MKINAKGKIKTYTSGSNTGTRDDEDHNLYSQVLTVGEHSELERWDLVNNSDVRGPHS